MSIIKFDKIKITMSYYFFNAQYVCFLITILDGSVTNFIFKFDYVISRFLVYKSTFYK